MEVSEDHQRHRAPLVALTYRSAINDPGRFSRSRTVGAYFGLTPGKYQSGETDRDGGITRVGDSMVRASFSMRERKHPVQGFRGHWLLCRSIAIVQYHAIL